MEEIEATIMRITALGKQADTNFSAAAAPQPGGPRNASMKISIGTRVLDLVSGQNGVVFDGRRESITLPTS